MKLLPDDFRPPKVGENRLVDCAPNGYVLMGHGSLFMDNFPYPNTPVLTATSIYPATKKYADVFKSRLHIFEFKKNDPQLVFFLTNCTKNDVSKAILTVTDMTFYYYRHTYRPKTNVP